LLTIIIDRARHTAIDERVTAAIKEAYRPLGVGALLVKFASSPASWVRPALPRTGRAFRDSRGGSRAVRGRGSDEAKLG
jgi:hypothetical protein